MAQHPLGYVLYDSGKIYQFENVQGQNLSLYKLIQRNPLSKTLFWTWSLKITNGKFFPNHTGCHYEVFGPCPPRSVKFKRFPRGGGGSGVQRRNFDWTSRKFTISIFVTHSYFLQFFKGFLQELKISQKFIQNQCLTFPIILHEFLSDFNVKKQFCFSESSFFFFMFVYTKLFSFWNFIFFLFL